MVLHVVKILQHPQLDLKAVARKAGLPELRLEQIARGADPNLAELRTLSAYFKVPVDSLLSEAERPSAALAFRKNLSSAVNPREAVAEESFSRSLAQISSFTNELPSNVHWLDAFDDEFKPNVAHAERFAVRFRALLGLDDHPLHELPQLLTNALGLFIVLRDSQAVEGASAIVGQHCYIFLSARSFRPRMLFTLAHELGHLVAHGGRWKREFAYLDSELRVGQFGREKDEEERFANAFATSLLLPKPAVALFLKAVRESQGLKGELGDVEILYLARFFGVGFEVAGYRCEQLELLPRGGANTLYTQIRDEYGSPEKRADRIGIPPRSAIEFDFSESLIDAGIEKVRLGQASVGYVSETLGVPISLLVARNSERLQ